MTCSDKKGCENSSLVISNESYTKAKTNDSRWTHGTGGKKKKKAPQRIKYVRNYR